MNDHVAAYDAQSERLAAEYEALDPSVYRATYSTLLPCGPGLPALDVGASFGREPAWLAVIVFEVVAAEPSSWMCAAGMVDAEMRNKVFFQKLGI